MVSKYVEIHRLRGVGAAGSIDKFSITTMLLRDRADCNECNGHTM